MPNGGSVAELKQLFDVKVVDGQHSVLKHVSMCFIDRSTLTLLLQLDGKFFILGKSHAHNDIFVRQIYSAEREEYAVGMPIENSSLGLMLVDDLGICIDKNGSPIGSTLRLDQIKKPIFQTAVVNESILLLTESNICIIDIKSGELQQTIEYPVPLQGDVMCVTSRNNTRDRVALIMERSVWLIGPKSARRMIEDALNKRETMVAEDLLDHNQSEEDWYFNAYVDCGYQYLQQGMVFVLIISHCYHVAFTYRAS